MELTRLYNANFSRLTWVDVSILRYIERGKGEFARELNAPVVSSLISRGYAAPGEDAPVLTKLGTEELQRIKNKKV